ncbi:MAG: peptidoglycan DD-metalloendopeptidase family protein [bacterium]|nr:peptidoglycan DD-metalloendopeptidase family protein [bacterium]
MFFPTLKIPWTHVALNDLARVWLTEHHVSERDANPLLDPTICQQMVDAYHQKNTITHSFGGYLENRRELWRGSYLEGTGNYLHLGIDWNAPVGTPVALPVSGQAFLIDCDTPDRFGWGNRVWFKLSDDNMLIVAHLNPAIACRAGDTVSPGQAFASVGTPEHNGGWFSHIHTQLVDGTYFQNVFQRNALTEIDGYGAVDQIDTLRALFKNPLSLQSYAS